MKIDIHNRKDGGHEIYFELFVKDPEVVKGPCYTLRGIDHDASVGVKEHSTHIQGDPLSWFGFILGIVDNPAVVQAIRNQYEAYLAEAAMDNDA